MSDQNPPSTPAGWYPDGRGGQRWWDGTRWTEHVQPAAAPAPPAPTPPAPAAPAAPPAASDQTMIASAPVAGPSYGGAPAAPAAPNYGSAPAAPAAPSYGQPPAGGNLALASFQVPANRGGSGARLPVVWGLILLFFAVMVAGLFLLGGSSPSAVAQDFYDKAEAGDCSSIDLASDKLRDQGEGNLVTVKDCEAADDKSDYLGSSGDDGCSFATSDEKVDGDRATVKYEITGCDDEDLNGDGTMTLVKVDGDWLVDEIE